MTAILELEDIHHSYRRPGLFSRSAGVPILSGVSLEVRHGECVGLIGESGSGKSTLAAIAAGLIDLERGRVRLDGAALPPKAAARPADARRLLQMVFQDPSGSLDPMQTVADAVSEGPRHHGLAGWTADRNTEVARLLGEVGLAMSLASRRPHALSGGQRQRVAMARALAVEPKVIVLDEPTSALDVSVQAQILNLLLELQSRLGLAYLLISHDLAVVRHLCQRVYVLAGGVLVESGPASEVLVNPRHSYTQALVAAAAETHIVQR